MNRIAEIISIFLLVIGISCKNSQETSIKTSQNKPLNFKDSTYQISTKKNQIKLRGPVKYYKSYFTKDLNKISQDTLDLMHDFTAGFYHFDKKGRALRKVSFRKENNLSLDSLAFSKELDLRITIYRQSNLDYNNKIEILPKKHIPFSVKNPYEIELNKRLFNPVIFKKSTDSLGYYSLVEFKYDLNKSNHIKIKKKLLGDDFNENGILDNNEEQIISSITTYEYNSQNQIIVQNFESSSKGLGPDLLEGEFAASEGASQRYEFSYDNEERIKVYTLKIGGEFCKSEIYTYLPNGELQTRELLINMNKSIKSVPRNRVIQNFDGFGNIIEETNYDADGKIYNHRKYTYEYDKYHNWTRCEMYFTGNTSDPPSLVNERIIEYYN